MKLIVGLGNPGRIYAANRHNIGFMCLNYFARQQGIRFYNKQSLARTGSGKVAGNKIILAKPQTYMNLSGQSVCRLVKKFNLPTADLLVIHDDLDLPLGKIRLRQGGSSGGHKGIASIIAELQSEDFARLRIGIGRPDETSEADIVVYVLSDFTPAEKRLINKAIPQVSEAILGFLTEGIAIAMSRYN